MRDESRAITRIDAFPRPPFSFSFFHSFLLVVLFIVLRGEPFSVPFLAQVRGRIARQIKLQLTPKCFPLAWDASRTYTHIHPQFSRVITKVSHRCRRIRHSRSRVDERRHNLCDTTYSSRILITEDTHVCEEYHWNVVNLEQMLII